MYQPHWARSTCEICPAGSYCKAFGKVYYKLVILHSKDQKNLVKGTHLNDIYHFSLLNDSFITLEIHVRRIAKIVAVCINFQHLFYLNYHIDLFHFTGDYEVLDAPNVTLSGNYTNRYRSYRGVSVPTACPPGSYCPAGTKDAMEYLCLEGTYSNKTSLNNYTQCTACDPGYYCSGQGIMSYSVGNQTNSLIKKLPNGKL